MFANCEALSNLPDLSKWDTQKLNNISNMFSNCKSLKNIPDISKWNFTNINDFNYMFSNCQSLVNLPIILKWKIINIQDMAHLLLNDIKNEINMKYSIDDNQSSIKMFGENFVKNNKKNALLLINNKISEIDEYYDLKENNNEKELFVKLIEINNITDLSYMFEKCRSLISVTDFSEYNMINITKFKLYVL
jgi:surface protein